MSSEGPRLIITLFCVLGFSGGCSAIPPIPEHAQNVANTDGDEYDGWLFKRLMGQQTESAAQTEPNRPLNKSVSESSGATAGLSSSVSPSVSPRTAGQASSGTLSQRAAVGPLIPGPSSSHGTFPSRSALELVPAPPDAPAGPPPSIPVALPPPPDGGVSINNAAVKTEEDSGFQLSDLAPGNIYTNVKQAAGYGPDEKIARAAIQEGKALFREKKYKAAAGKFATAATRWPDSPLEEDALFLKGESEFFSDRYPEAHDTFGGLLKKYSNTRHLDTVVAREFALGRYWEQLFDAKPTWPIVPNVTDGSRPRFDTFGYAVQAHERVRQHDPTGPLADDSLLALGNAYFRHGQFENAAYHYDLLRKEYPNSEHQMNAHLLGVQAKMRVYQGTSYDGSPLKEGEKIASQTLTQFGRKLGAERDRVTQAHAQIVEEQANRDFIIARYYEQRKRYGAARLYYQSIVKEFPRTRKAEEAKARMEAIRNEPDEPPNRFAWLTGLFDSEKK